MLDSAEAESVAAARAERAAKIKEKYAGQTAAALKMAKDSGWCALEGTPPQNRWAAAIRAEKIAILGSAASLIAAQVGSSKFWIDNINTDRCDLERRLNSNDIARQVEKTQQHAIIRAKNRTANKAKLAVAARLDKQLKYLLNFSDLLIEVPATQALGRKIGELERDGFLHRFFQEGGGLLRIITGDASGRGKKTNYTLRLSTEMHADMEKI